MNDNRHYSGIISEEEAARASEDRKGDVENETHACCLRLPTHRRLDEVWNTGRTLDINVLLQQVYIGPSNDVLAPSTHAGHVTSPGQPRVTSILTGSSRLASTVRSYTSFRGVRW